MCFLLGPALAQGLHPAVATHAFLFWLLRFENFTVICQSMAHSGSPSLATLFCCNPSKRDAPPFSSYPARAQRLPAE